MPLPDVSWSRRHSVGGAAARDGRRTPARRERSMEMKLELVPIPVGDVDRAKAFYVERLGFVEDVDVRPAEGVRVVQLTPPGSACSIGMGTGMPRSEERRVGKECRSWWSPDHY